ncbi:lactate/malate dehydrogenase family protein, partial [Acidithiobacillus sp. GGI-221]
MDVSIIGANGSTGKHIASRILLERLLLPTDRLQLVGRRDGSSGNALYGFRQDLKDAFAEHCPIIDIALQPEEVVADIIVMAAGKTIQAHSDPGKAPPSRDELAIYNQQIAIPYADALVQYGHGHEVVIVVTNPVELIVEIFSQRYDRHRIVGMGAYQDSLRFRREVARSINVSREAVRAMVLGEHGDGIVPLWSSVTIQG